MAYDVVDTRNRSVSSKFNIVHLHLKWCSQTLILSADADMQGLTLHNT
jgi:hypothetical protein